MDVADYQKDLIRYCQDPLRHPESSRGRFGVLEFVFGVVQNRGVRHHLEGSVEKSDWCDFDSNADENEPAFEYTELTYADAWKWGEDAWQPRRYVATRRERPGLSWRWTRMSCRHPVARRCRREYYVSNLSPEKHEAS